MKMTDWNAEAELLKEYLAYCIEWRFNNHPYFTLKAFKETGVLYFNPDHAMPTFEDWKSCKKGNFVWEDGPGSKVVFQPNENGRWSIESELKTKEEISNKLLEDEQLKDLFKSDFDHACDVYRSYVGKAESPKERAERIKRFRCGGRY